MLIDRLRDTMGAVWREVAKFGIVGAISFIVDIGGFNLLIAGPMSGKVTTAKIISGAVATIVAWIGNRYWTYRNRHNRPVHHEVFLFFAVNAVALAVASAWVAFAHYVLGAHSPFWLNVHAFIGIGLGTIIRFIAYRTIVFAEDPDLQADQPQDLSVRH